MKGKKKHPHKHSKHPHKDKKHGHKHGKQHKNDQHENMEKQDLCDKQEPNNHDCKVWYNEFDHCDYSEKDNGNQYDMHESNDNQHKRCINVGCLFKCRC